MAPLDDTTRAQIEALTRDAEALLRRSRFDTLASLDEPRHALLAQRLGFAPARPVPAATVVGDSHALFFAGTENMGRIRYRHVGLFRRHHVTRGIELLPCFRVFSIGPATAWQAFEPRTSTRCREKIELLIRRGDIDRARPLLLSFGEIDCRCHIPRVVLSGTPVAQAVESTVRRFLRLPCWLRAQGFRPAIWGPACIAVRPTNEGHPLPVVGPYVLRRDITRAYAQTLAALAAEEGFPCVSLAGVHHDWETQAPESHTCDGFHLSQSLMPLALDRLRQIGVLPFAATGE